MLDKILEIIPTKERFNDFCMFADSWENTTEGFSDVLVVTDKEDSTYTKLKEIYPFKWETSKLTSPLEILNEAATKYCQEYRWLSFMEDDCIHISPNWETSFILKLKELGKNGIVYCNDMLNESGLVGIPFMDSSIIARLGYMCPPGLKAGYADNFWKQLGEDMGSLYYFDELIIEHRHFSTGKRKKDSVSCALDAYTNERKIYLDYYVNSFKEDFKKLTIEENKK